MGPLGDVARAGRHHATDVKGLLSKPPPKLCLDCHDPHGGATRAFLVKEEEPDAPIANHFPRDIGASVIRRIEHLDLRRRHQPVFRKDNAR